MPKLFSPEDLRVRWSPCGRKRVQPGLQALQLIQAAPGGGGCVEQKGPRRVTDVIGQVCQSPLPVRRPRARSNGLSWNVANLRKTVVVVPNQPSGRVSFSGVSTPCPSDLRDSRRAATAPRLFRTGENRPIDSGTSSTGSSSTYPARIALELPSKSWRDRRRLPCKTNGLLLMQALENERVGKQRWPTMRRGEGPLEGLRQIADDPDYLPGGKGDRMRNRKHRPAFDARPGADVLAGQSIRVDVQFAEQPTPRVE